MSKTKIAITLDSALLDELDALVEQRQFPNRSQAVEAALTEKLARIGRVRLARECAKLVPAEEQALADEGLAQDARTWPAY